jgi:hypothetical protein
LVVPPERDAPLVGVVVETTLPFALTARKVLARPVTARLVVVAEVVVERPATRLVNVELAVEMIPLLKVCKADHVFALPRFKPMVLVVDPLYPPAKVRVPSAVRELRFNPRATPEMVELARYALVMELFGSDTVLVAMRLPKYPVVAMRLVPVVRVVEADELVK